MSIFKYELTKGSDYRFITSGGNADQPIANKNYMYFFAMEISSVWFKNLILSQLDMGRIPTLQFKYDDQGVGYTNIQDYSVHQREGKIRIAFLLKSWEDVKNKIRDATKMYVISRP